MKYRNYIFGVILAFTTLVAWWVIPSLVEKMTDDSRSYPLMYYSARLKELCLIDFRNNKGTFQDAKGNVYPRARYDSLLPLLNARQLMLDGALPDSIDGHAIDMKELRTRQVSFRYRPVDKVSPQPPMGVLFEAMPKRGKLSLPGDFFNLEDKIIFVNAETNVTDKEKSDRFNRELEKKGFVFPARAFWGNPSTRKPYEEGYFCLDAKGQLFHLKMVNGRPFVKNTEIGNSLDIRWFVMSEVMDKRYYGFVFGAKGKVGIIEAGEGEYRFRPLEIRGFDLEKDQLTILGNVLYWTVTVKNEKGMDSYGLDCESLKCLSTYHQDRKRVLWDEASEWLFPCYLSFSNENNAYVGFYWSAGAWKAFVLNLALGLVMFLMLCRCSGRKRWLSSVYVFLCGIPGMVALLILPDWKR